jgi:hypothetical protein
VFRWNSVENCFSASFCKKNLNVPIGLFVSKKVWPEILNIFLSTFLGLNFIIMEFAAIDLIEWENHSNEVFSVIRQLRFKESFSDVSLHCGGRHFATHKVILAACSPFFERILSGMPSDKTNNPVLVMTETKVEMLERIIEFMYNGQVVVDSCILQEFLDVANKLEIRGLSKVNVNLEPKTSEAQEPDSLTELTNRTKLAERLPLGFVIEPPEPTAATTSPFGSDSLRSCLNVEVTAGEVSFNFRSLLE